MSVVAQRWPLPALLAWAAAWALWQWWHSPLLAMLAPLAAAALVRGRWRQALTLLGFPLSAALLHGAWPAWAWLLPLAALLLIYPLQAWRDAPLFPTAPDALVGLRGRLALPPSPSILDAGSGLGHGLAALAREWPDARLQGIERSALLNLGARLRVPAAQLHGGDFWAHSWAGHDLVYLFQRPESMARAWAKAEAELSPGAWLVSLEFAVPGVAPAFRLEHAGRRTVWVYRAQSRSAGADKRR
jgi:hypothetical protein